MSAFTGLGFPAEQVVSVDIPFGEWLPDQPPLNNPGAAEALNVLPGAGGYNPFPQHVAIAGLTLPAAAYGAITVFDNSGSPQLFGATLSDIYQRVGSAFVSRFTSPTPLYSEYMWQFVQFGTQLVALHPQLIPQAGEVGGSTLFTPLGGDPPIAHCGARVGDFLVLGDLYDIQDPDNPNRPSRIRWSGYNNIDSPWITDPATQADFNDMPAEAGRVMAITGRETGTIFQERSISRITYEGLPAVFDIQTVEEEIGAICGGGVIDVGAFVFFIASDGFRVWNGTNSTPIGENKASAYLFKRLNYAARSRVVGAIDYVNECVMWAIPTTSDVLDEIIIYSYKENRFTHVIQLAVEYLFLAATLDVSLDDLGGNLDTDYPISFDDYIYRGGKPILGAFSSAHAYGLFNGTPMAATLDTGEYSAPDAHRVYVTNSLPIVDVAAAAVTVQTGRRDQFIGEALVFDAAVSQEITGECPIRADAHYMRFRVNIPAGTTWNFASGIKIWRKATGRR